jgi:ribosomal protein S18 acetylase RimI-like enzyme
MKSEQRLQNLKIEQARAEDAPSIWEIIKTSFTDPISQYTAIGQPGYENFLSDFLANESPGRKLMVLGRVRGDTVAFADITIGQRTPNFLTRIAVRQDFRGSGLANKLMREVHQLYGGGNKWELDVFDTNLGAVRLYTSLGFKVLSTKRWICRMPKELSKPRILDQETPRVSDSRYLRYGFTSLLIDGKTLNIAGTAVKCPNVSLFTDAYTLTKVKTLYPDVDRAFITIEEPRSNDGMPDDSFEIATNYRMSGTF